MPKPPKKTELDRHDSKNLSLSPLEQDRVQTWKNRRTKDNPGFSYKLGKKKRGTTQIKTDFSA